MLSLVTYMIIDQFIASVGKWQVKSETGLKGLYIKFRISIDYDKEEGYRWVELFIYAPMNYVQVWTRESWNTILLDDMEEDGDEMMPKKGKDYVRGGTEWKKVADHDSGWTEGVTRTLSDYERRIVGFSHNGGDRWYAIAIPPPEIQGVDPIR